MMNSERLGIKQNWMVNSVTMVTLLGFHIVHGCTFKHLFIDASLSLSLLGGGANRLSQEYTKSE